MRKFLWFLQAAIALAISFPLSLMTVSAGEFFGLILYHIWTSRRKIAVDNLKASVSLNALHITQPPEEIIKDNFKNLGRSFIEVLKLFYGQSKKVLEKTNVKGRENLENALQKGKGAILITGHCGNWELLAIYALNAQTPLSVVARPLNNPYLNKALEKFRTRFGNRMIYKKGALKNIISTLRSSGMVGILMDQAVLSNEGYVIDFLGRGAWTTKMPSLMARKTGSPVLPVFIRRSGKGHEVVIHPEIVLSSNSSLEGAVREDTERFSGFLEGYIKQNPSEWLWLHRRWKRTPQQKNPFMGRL